MNRLIRALFVLLFLATTLCASSQSSSDSVSEVTKYSPTFSLGLSYRLPQTKSIDLTYRPFRFCEIKATTVYGKHQLLNEFGLDKFKVTGKSGGLGISLFDTYLENRNHTLWSTRNGWIASFFVGKGVADISGEVVYPGDVHSDRNESYEISDVKYWYFDVKIGFEIILKRHIRVELYPIQIGWFDTFPKREYPLKYLPPIGDNNGWGRLSSGAGIHWQFDLNKR